MARTRSFDTDKVLDQVMVTFWRNGFDQTGVRELTAASGVKSQSLYNAYGPKEQLYVRALDHYLMVAKHAADAVVVSDEGPEAKLVDLLILDWGRLPYPPGCMVISAMSEFEQIDPQLTDVSQQLFDYLTARFKVVLGAMAAKLRPDLDVATVADALLTMHNGLQVAARAGMDMSTMQTIARTTVRALTKEDA